MNPTVVIIVLVAVVVALVAAAIVFAVSRRGASTVEPERSGVPSKAVDRGAAIAAPPTLRTRLAKTRRAVGDKLSAAFRRSTIDTEFWDAVEEALIAADVGHDVAADVVSDVRSTSPATGAEARAAVQRGLVARLAGRDRALHLDSKPAVILVVGVNGTGKTTSIAKLAARFQAEGRSVLLAAADTFRAAADEQLRTWAERVGVEIVMGDHGSDPASVAFDGFSTATATGADTLIVDTAGRLQTKSNLMDELGKIARVLAREAGRIDEVLLVIDGTTGQNAITQAHSFGSVVDITGIVLTKLDGTSRGGVAIAVETQLDTPVKFIGIGEGLDDLIPFDPEAFVDALVGE